MRGPAPNAKKAAFCAENPEPKTPRERRLFQLRKCASADRGSRTRLRPKVALDLLLIFVLSSSFGLLVSAHVALVVGLSLRAPRWRGALALVVPPLAPYWGWEAKMRVRAALWALGLAVYAMSLTASAL